MAIIDHFPRPVVIMHVHKDLSWSCSRQIRFSTNRRRSLAFIVRFCQAQDVEDPAYTGGRSKETGALEAAHEGQSSDDVRSVYGIEKIVRECQRDFFSDDHVLLCHLLPKLEAGNAKFRRRNNS
jgi:hypothetical protein